MEWDEATKALINDVATTAADKTVERTMTSFGIDVRTTWNSAKSRSIFVAVGLMITGFFSFLWAAVKASFHTGN